jgi:Rps23 Pro-64 3,4-dihydroxylase Tpa1-like proline 4-hydroxylase
MEQKKLRKIANDLALKIKNSDLNVNPFQHVVIDDFLPKSLASDAMNSFPPLDDPCWDHSSDKGIEVKSRTTWKSEFDIPENIIDVIRIVNSSLILQAMSDVLSIPKLMPDPYFAGGGLNVSETNGHLDVHVDGNYHDASGLNRRINLLIYFNPNWKNDWGGEFGIYSNDGSDLLKAIPPLFNRCVIFDTHDKSFHGLPNPIKFPKEEPRKSIITYYYTKANRPSDNVVVNEPHSALWKSKGLLDKRGKKTRDFD